jgi:CBS-domain-containing membrane protein
MRRDFVTTEPDEMLQSAFERLQDCDCHTLPVVRDGRLLGVLSADNLAEILMIQEALKASKAASRGRKARREERVPVRLAETPSVVGFRGSRVV